jgi:hypothetical protein
MLRCCRHARAKIAEIVGVRAVQEDRDAAASGF